MPQRIAFYSLLRTAFYSALRLGAINSCDITIITVSLATILLPSNDPGIYNKNVLHIFKKIVFSSEDGFYNCSFISIK